MAINFTPSQFSAARAAQTQTAASQQQQSAMIGAQIRADARKSQLTQAQVRSETAVRVHQMQSETYVNRARSSQRIHSRVLQLMSR